MSMTPREKFNNLKAGKSDGTLLVEWEAFAPILCDPVMRFVRGNRKEGEITKDPFGTTFHWPMGQIAATPYITKENKVIKDITKWRDYLNVPDLKNSIDNDWSAALEARAKVEAEGRQFSMAMMGTGLFEQLHFLMGFEDTLMNLIRRPKEMMELCEVLGEYRFSYAKLLVENFKPEIVLSHDDWGTKAQLFMRPEAFRKFIKPLYLKMYGYFKDNGVMVMHHSDSYAETLVPDMIEMGVDIWQGALPENNIPKILKEYGKDIIIMGGIDASIVDRVDSTEEEIRAETRRACREYGPLGHYIPAMTYGLSNHYLYPHVQQYLADEIRRYNAEIEKG